MHGTHAPHNLRELWHFDEPAARVNPDPEIYMPLAAFREAADNQAHDHLADERQELMTLLAR